MCFYHKENILVIMLFWGVCKNLWFPFKPSPLISTHTTHGPIPCSYKGQDRSLPCVCSSEDAFVTGPCLEPGFHRTEELSNPHPFSLWCTENHGTTLATENPHKQHSKHKTEDLPWKTLLKVTMPQCPLTLSRENNSDSSSTPSGRVEIKWWYS